MTVPWDLASTTMLLWLGEATQALVEPHSWDGGQPPQVPPHPSSPQNFAVQLGLQLEGGPESGPRLEELVDWPELVLSDDPAWLDEPLPEGDPVWLTDAPLPDDDPRPDEP